MQEKRNHREREIKSKIGTEYETLRKYTQGK